MKKKQKVQIFKLEERVLFDGAAAAEIVAAVNNAGDAHNADQADNDSEQDQEEKFVQNTVQNAGPVDVPAPDANVQNDGDGLPQADAAQNDPADVLINGSADFSQATDVNADADAAADADTLQVTAELDADAVDHADLIVIDADAAEQIDLDVLDGKNVLVLDGDSDAADQIEDWMNDHAGQEVDSVLVVSDSDSLDIQLDNAELETISVDDFQADLDQGAPADDVVIMPDNDTVFTVDADTAELPAELSEDAAADRHELVIVNSTTADLDNVLNQLGDSREVLIVDTQSEVSGLEQVENYLAEHSDTQYDAIHVLTHGNDYGVLIGSDFVTDANDFSVFSDHITADGDLMLYGCSMASSQQGHTFLHDIAGVTGADVAASVNTTGSAGLGGDWTLEYSSGRIDTESISLDASWNHRFETITINADAKDRSATVAKSLNEALVTGWDYGTDHHNPVTGEDTLALVKVKDIQATFNKAGLTVNAGSLVISTEFTIASDTTISGGYFTGARLTINAGATLTAESVHIAGTVNNNNGTVVGTMDVRTGPSTPGNLTIGSGNWGTAEKSFTLTQSTSGRVVVNDGATFTNATIQATNGTVRITGGDFYGSSTQSGTGIDFSSSENLDITGGTFRNFNQAILFHSSSKEATAIISGGEFSGNVYAITNSGSGTLLVTGATNIHDNYKTGATINSGAGIRNTGSGLLDVHSLTNPITRNYYGIHNTGSNSDSVIENLSITNNYSSGIRNEGTLSHIGPYIPPFGGGRVGSVTLTNNGLGTDSTGCYTTLGGGIYNSGTIKVLETTNITNNHALTGGGIYNNGNIGEGITGYIDQVYVSGNKAVRGGGIYQDGGYFMFSDIRQIGVTPLITATGAAGIGGNVAHKGAGIYFASGNFLLKGIEVVDNTSRWIQKSGDTTEGGGIYIASGTTVTLDNVKIDGNTVESQDKIINPSYWKYYYNDPNMDIGDVAPATDTGGRGGGIFNAGTLKIIQSEISSNTTEFTNTRQLPDYYAFLNTLAMGGGIYSSGTLTVYDSYIHDNRVTNGNGGGVYVASGTASFVSTEYLTGQSKWGLTDPGYSVNAMIISRNTASSVSDGTKLAAGGFGGGVYVDSGATVTFDSVTIADNTATLSVITDTGTGKRYDLSRGGGVYFGESYLYQVDSNNTTAPAFGSGTLTIDGTVRNWNATDDLALLGVNLRQSLIFGNSAVSGGGVYVTGKGTATITNTEIYNNDYKIPAGSVDAYFTNEKIAEQQFKLLVETSNQQNPSLAEKPSDSLSQSQITAAGQLFTARGNGLYFGGEGMTLSLDRVSVYDNSAVNNDAMGGGIYATGSLFKSSQVHLNVVNATLYKNSGDLGAGMYINDKALVNILDTTIAGNIAKTLGGGVFITGGSSEVNILNSILVGNTGEGKADDLTSAMDTVSVHDKFSLFGKMQERNSSTLQYVTRKPDSTSMSGVTVKDIFTGGSLETAWSNVGEIYSKTTVVNGQLFTNSEYSYTTHTLSIKTTGPAATRGVYTAINTSSSQMYYNTTAPSELESDVTKGWLSFKDGSSASVAKDIIVTLSQNGRYRLVSGSSVYSVGAFSLESIMTVVNTFIDDSIAGNKYYSLREAILAAAGKTASVTFDAVALQQEIDSKGFQPYFLLDSVVKLSSGSITLDFGQLSKLVLPTGAELSVVRTGNFDDVTTGMFVLSGTAALAVSDITVYGNNLQVTANGAAFKVGSGSTLELTDVKINGASTSADGGAIYAGSGSTVKLAGTNSFRNNAAGNGGALYAGSGSTVKLSGTNSFLNNRATGNGGAIYNAIALSVTGNFAGNSADGNGGAIYNTANFTLNGNISNSTAGRSGGAVYNTGSFTQDGNISKSTATNGNGGAVYNTGSFTLDGNVSNSTAANGNGGAVYNTGSFTQNGNISTSTATNGDGGAIYNTGTLSLTGNISRSTAGGDGGAIYNTGTLALTGNISNSTATGRGGAIFANGGTTSVLGNITGGTAADGSIVHLQKGNVQLGDLDHYIRLTGNQGNIVTVEAGNLFITNALIKGNGTDGATLFTVDGGSMTLLNSTVTGNKGDLITNNGTVQIGDSTIAFNADTAQITGSGIVALNSIINAANDFTVTGTGNVIRELPENVFVLKNGNPVTDKNGTLRISLTGRAAQNGVMVGYKTSAGATTLYYTTDGEIWHQADGATATVSGITSVEKSQNDAVRLSGTNYAMLSIGAYSLDAAALSLVVTISSDTPREGEMTLRDAVGVATYLYALKGEAQTITFKVGEVKLDSTITILAPVNIRGSVTVTTTNAFADDTVFVVDGSSETAMSGLTIVGKAGVRGITLQNGALSLGNVTIRDAGMGDNGGAIYAVNGSLSGRDVRLINNMAVDGAAIYSQGAEIDLSGFTLRDNIATAGSIITSKLASANDLTLVLENGVIQDNTATANMVNAAGPVALITVSAVNNTMGNALLTASSADILNSSLTGAPDDGSALVEVTGDLNVANSIIVTPRSGWTSVDAGRLNSAYSIFSGKPVFAANTENLTGHVIANVFTGTVENGRPVINGDSPAATGVWTQYDAETRSILYSVRPENVWTENYSPEYMQWRYLGGGKAGYNPSLLVGSTDSPSIGAYWLADGKNHPDYGPGVNSGMVNPSFNGGFGTDWGYNSVVNAYGQNPYSSLTTESESGMGWYATMLADLFGYRSSQSGTIAVSGAVPGEDMDLSVDGVQEDFNEFQEAPYRAQDGSPLSPSEQADLLRSITLNRRLPEDTLNLSEAVHQQVASSLRSAELFKDSFDKALESLLGQDA